MNAWLIPLYLALCFVVADLLAPLAVYLLYRCTWAIRGAMMRIPTAKGFAEHIVERTSKDIGSIKPPKTIQYLRHHWGMPRQKQDIKRVKEVVSGLNHECPNVLLKDTLNLVNRPLLKFGFQDFGETLHALYSIKVETGSQTTTKQNPLYANLTIAPTWQPRRYDLLRQPTIA